MCANLSFERGPRASYVRPYKRTIVCHSRRIDGRGRVTNIRARRGALLSGYRSPHDSQTLPRDTLRFLLREFTMKLVEQQRLLGVSAFTNSILVSSQAYSPPISTNVMSYRGELKSGVAQGVN